MKYVKSYGEEETESKPFTVGDLDRGKVFKFDRGGVSTIGIKETNTDTSWITILSGPESGKNTCIGKDTKVTLLPNAVLCGNEE